ncbi:TDP-N-acetylfucosamine:lipid II N-acetylfucosaminyltransferase [Clostridium brassicae]|uniref:TDP-N-acetylfucosamine:lipid II N-acetylfucosaminyltransferase n=1 Tax=Clostridium brassicae TaxID=2999072 RepID=A0ABT4DB78_9CLOT|nr:TDP-N-acetylfucosamine:lipid II N-acetylfucosaminyltransferase [Clostridium brassicae]MCY6959563.1 TDP-N-acetylfucosamine:lipid II N-acetylfucosaminyltransferase [Clostridium brassicae]
MSKKEKIIFFGASKMGEAAYVLLKDNYDIVCFCDNDKNKWGKNFCGVEIISPESLKKDELKNIQVIITSMYYKEIGKQLEMMEIQNYQVFDFKFRYKEEVQYCNERYKEFKHIIDNSYFNNKNHIKNLHLMQDSFYNKKFIEFVNENFLQDEHKFIIIKPSDYELKYIDNIDNYDNVEILYQEYFEPKLYYYVKSSEKVFIHYLYDYICEFIYKYDIGKNVELNWKVWGGDFYNIEDFCLYDEGTKQLLRNLGLGNLLEKQVDKKYKNYRKKTLENITYILCGFKYDYDLIINQYKCDAVYRKMFYQNPIDFEKLDNIKNKSPLNLKEKYKYVIMVGNSADPSNNHIEILEQLKRFRDEDLCVIVPLSYGVKKYADYIKKEGERILGDKFIALMEFYSSEDYYNILNEVDVCIMNHNRPQGVGNIFTLMYLEKKVMIKPNVSTYKGIKELGGNVFDVSGISNSLEKLIYIDDNSKFMNRNIFFENLKKTISKEAYLKIFE